MRKLIYFTGTCALVAAAAIFVWSQSALVSSRTNTASASLLSHGSLLAAEAATTSITSSPEVMSNDSRPLPVEQWDAF